MYSPSQILKGVKQPRLAKREIRNRWKQARPHLPHDIGIHGSYRTGNVGDRAIGESLVQQLSAKGHRVKLFGKDIEYSAAPVRILGGGGVLHDWYGVDHLRTRLNFLSERGAAIGVGVPGFRTDEARELVAEKLSDKTLVTVRDEWSYERLATVYDGQIHTTACPAFLHENPQVSATGRTGVNFPPWFYLDPSVMSYYFDYDADLDHERAKVAYLENVTRICEEVSNPVFIPFHEKDEEFARRHLDIEILPYKFSVERTLKRVSAVEKMVATRYHSLVFAAICETPTLAIAYEPKVSSLADRLGIASYKPHETVPVTFDAITNRDSVRQHAERNFQLLDEHLVGQL